MNPRKETILGPMGNYSNTSQGKAEYINMRELLWR